jgi:hypothetical protein
MTLLKSVCNIASKHCNYVTEGSFITESLFSAYILGTLDIKCDSAADISWGGELELMTIGLPQKKRGRRIASHHFQYVTQNVAGSFPGNDMAHTLLMLCLHYVQGTCNIGLTPYSRNFPVRYNPKHQEKLPDKSQVPLRAVMTFRLRVGG